MNESLQMIFLPHTLTFDTLFNNVSAKETRVTGLSCLRR